jgi:hypothetical protein
VPKEDYETVHSLSNKLHLTRDVWLGGHYLKMIKMCVRSVFIFVALDHQLAARANALHSRRPDRTPNGTEESFKICGAALSHKQHVGIFS